MASAQTPRSRTDGSHRSQPDYDNERKSTPRTTLDQDQTDDYDNKELCCPFCRTYCRSTLKFKEHMTSCGNKTDECPTCKKYVRRAIFAYHYENNCAQVDDSDIRAPKRSNIDDHDQENDYSSAYEPFDNRRKISARVSSSVGKKGGTLDASMGDGYDDKYDQANNFRKSMDANKRPEKISSQNESELYERTSDAPQDIVHIPCEFCNELVDINIWSRHTQDCREKENRRITDLAEKINQKPVTEKMPCEHCKELFPIQKIRNHEITCEKNPAYKVRVAKSPPIRPRSSVSGREKSLAGDQGSTSLSNQSVDAASSLRTSLAHDEDPQGSDKIRKGAHPMHGIVKPQDPQPLPDFSRADKRRASVDHDHPASRSSNESKMFDGTSPVSPRLTNSKVSIDARSSLPHSNLRRQSTDSTSSSPSSARPPRGASAGPQKNPRPSTPSGSPSLVSPRPNSRGSSASRVAMKPLPRKPASDPPLLDEGHQPKIMGSSRDRKEKSKPAWK